MKTQSVGLMSLAGYLPAKKLGDKMEKLFHFLENNDVLFPNEYIAQMRETGLMPGRIETNFDGWESQPWFKKWLSLLPPKKQNDPFQGTKNRRRVPFDPVSLRESIHPHPMKPSDAETLAAAMAIVNAGIDKNEIDLVISHSQVSDFALPQNASLIQHKLGLKNAAAYSVDSCCSSFVTMIQTATAMVKAGIKNKVLIVSSYIDSHVNDYSDYFSIQTGDGAVAGIVCCVEDGFGYIESCSTSHGDRHDGIIFERRSPKMLKTIGTSPDYAQEFTTFYNQEACKAIGENASRDLAEVVFKTLEKAALSIDNVDFMVTHQPVAWAPRVWREAVGIPPEKFYESFEEYGNIATASAATNLLEAIEKDFIKAGDKVLITSSGAGENHIAVLEKISPTLINNVR